MLASAAEVSCDTIFYVTKYGARADGNTDISQALLKAWGDACSSPVASTVMTPDGTCTRPNNHWRTLQRSYQFHCPRQCEGPDGYQQVQGLSWLDCFRQIDQFTLSGGGVFDGQGKTVWGTKCPSSAYCNQLPINLTFYNVAISAPEERLNTDGIHIGRSLGINITYSTIETGDDCVSIGDGSEQINMQRVTRGPGHGTAWENGVRVKTWPASHQGTASEMHFEDIVMNNVGNPIIIDQEYCPHNQCNLKIPSRIMLNDVSFRNIRGTTSTQVAVKLVCSQGVPREDVELGDINLKYNGKEGHAMSQCKNIKPNLLGTQLPGLVPN
ncbi:Polygalacturonase [Vitis vinifera]|uniref:Polygalacturonase n=1 Tax=Vitis vinifera TaxID=29760 RepID=A0A438DQA3_VITVI|nr:Polygalacturonase [Vitis vinifera]